MFLSISEQSGHHPHEEQEDEGEDNGSGATLRPQGARAGGGSAAVPPRPLPPGTSAGGRDPPVSTAAPRRRPPGGGGGGGLLGRAIGLPVVVLRTGFGLAWAAVTLAVSVAGFVGDRVLPLGIMRSVRGERMYLRTLHVHPYFACTSAFYLHRNRGFSLF